MLSYIKRKILISVTLICCIAMYESKAMELSESSKREKEESIISPIKRLKVSDEPQTSIPKPPDCPPTIKCLREKILNALSRGDLPQVKLLVNAGADVNQADEYGAILFHRAVASGHKDIVELLLNAGADVNKADNGGYTPLHWAVYWNHKDIVELLLRVRANVNTKDKYDHTPLFLARRGAHKDIVKLLEEH
jgi:hypothetical protein